MAQDSFALIAPRAPTHMGTLEVLFHVTPGTPVAYDARFIFDAEGSAHADVEWTTF